MSAGNRDGQCPGLMRAVVTPGRSCRQSARHVPVTASEVTPGRSCRQSARHVPVTASEVTPGRSCRPSARQVPVTASRQARPRRPDMQPRHRMPVTSAHHPPRNAGSADGSRHASSAAWGHSRLIFSQGVRPPAWADGLSAIGSLQQGRNAATCSQSGKMPHARGQAALLQPALHQCSACSCLNVKETSTLGYASKFVRWGWPGLGSIWSWFPPSSRIFWLRIKSGLYSSGCVLPAVSTNTPCSRREGCN